ncbi:MAG: hypothetical protein DWQ02_04350 [Bacteroidetes bacterium]|nr:MAG: hypothetical protein DWQ02_04350 [Bacteroidota bacterium]
MNDLRNMKHPGTFYKISIVPFEFWQKSKFGVFYYSVVLKHLNSIPICLIIVHVIFGGGCPKILLFDGGV